MKKQVKDDWIDLPVDEGADDWQDVEDVGYLESLLRGGLQGSTAGWSDEITAGAEALFTDKSYDQALAESRANYKAAQEANPLTYGAGEIGGAIGTSLAPGLNIAKGASFAARAGQAAAMGAASGLGMSEADSVSGLAKDAVIGGALGAGMQGLGEKVISPAIKKAASYADDVAKTISSPNSKFNKALSKVGSFATGADDEAALRQIQRPQQVAAAESDDFSYKLGKYAVDEAESLGQELGSNVNKAGKLFQKEYGDLTFEAACYPQNKSESKTERKYRLC